jgi:prevent-host-death family protein
MDEIGVRELNQQTSKILRMVHDTGRSVAITDRGRRIAIIQPVRTDVFAEMVDGGLIAAGDGQLATVTRARSTRSVAEILAEIDRDST